MTEEEKRLRHGRERDRFIIHEGDIGVTGRYAPEPEEQAAADRLFSRILKNRKQRRE
jgi:hypothetical protein